MPKTPNKPLKPPTNNGLISKKNGSETSTTVSALRPKPSEPTSLRLSTRAFRSALDLTGAGTNPDVVEALSIMFKPFVEGPSIRPGGISPEANKVPNAPIQPSIAEAMYPHLVPNRGS